MKINVLGIVKGVSELVVSAGAGVVVGNLVRATTPYDLSKVQKVMVGVGGYAVGAVLGDLSAKYVSAQIDGYAERINEIIHPQEPLDPEEVATILTKAAEVVTEDSKKDDKSTDTE